MGSYIATVILLTFLVVVGSLGKTHNEGTRGQSHPQPYLICREHAIFLEALSPTFALAHRRAISVMADPFSIIAVTQTGLSVAQALTKLIQGLRSAPDELLALSNEVWNLKLVLDDVQELESSHNAPSVHKLDAVHALVYQIRIKLDTLSTLTAQWGRLSQWCDSFSIGRRDRFSWLKEKARFIKLQSELRELRSNLSTAVGTRTW